MIAGSVNGIEFLESVLSDRIFWPNYLSDLSVKSACQISPKNQAPLTRSLFLQPSLQTPEMLLSINAVIDAVPSIVRRHKSVVIQTFWWTANSRGSKFGSHTQIQQQACKHGSHIQYCRCKLTHFALFLNLNKNRDISQISYPKCSNWGQNAQISSVVRIGTALVRI